MYKEIERKEGDNKFEALLMYKEIDYQKHIKQGQDRERERGRERERERKRKKEREKKKKRERERGQER